MVWSVIDSVRLSYVQESANGTDFNNYVVCFGTTNSSDCDTTNGQIVPGKLINISGSKSMSGKVIIDADNYIVDCVDLKLNNGYSCTSSNELYYFE